MTEMANHPFKTFNPADEPGAVAARAPVGRSSAVDNASQPIGVVLEIAGSGSQIALDPQRLNECMEDADPSIALAGQVGSQVKIRTGDGWLLASVRDQRQDRRGSDGILAGIHFLAEGRWARLSGSLRGGLAGVASDPVAGAVGCPAQTAGLRQIDACGGRHACELGMGCPAGGIRAGLYVYVVLGQHFGLLGS